MHVGHEEIADGEDQIARASVSHSDLLASTESIENRNPNAVERDSEPLRSLPPM